MKEKVIHIIADVLKMSDNEIKEELTIETTPQWDSLAHLMIISELEEKLNIKIPFEMVAEIHSVKEILDLAEGRI